MDDTCLIYYKIGLSQIRFLAIASLNTNTLFHSHLMRQQKVNVHHHSLEAKAQVHCRCHEVKAQFTVTAPLKASNTEFC